MKNYDCRSTTASDNFEYGLESHQNSVVSEITLDIPTIIIPANSVSVIENGDTNPELVVASSSVLENNESCGLKQRKQTRYEILPGLWAELSDDAVVQIDTSTTSDSNDLKLTVRSKGVKILHGNHLLFSGENIDLKGEIFDKITADNNGIRTFRNIVVSIGRFKVDPLADREMLARFNDLFSLLPMKAPEKQQKQDIPSKPLSREQFEELCQNAKNDVRPEIEQKTKEERVQSVPDIIIPCVKILATNCEVSHNPVRTIDFPICEGSESCTLRTLIEYYMKSILNTIDIQLGNKADISAAAITSDIVSLKTSLIGGAIGGTLIGPIGFLAGSYIGGEIGRKHSSSIAGGVVGGALFGPAGMVAGAVTCAENKPTTTTANVSTKSKDSKKVLNKTTDNPCKKYEFAGATGAYAGSFVGVSTGFAVLGPFGVVPGAIAGAVAGSISGRKIVENTTATKKNNTGDIAHGSKTDEKPYEFGDITRGIISNGKKSRGANTKDKYQFGDFTRGLLKKMKNQK